MTEIILPISGFGMPYDALKEASGVLENGTYEAVGRHFNGNPYHLETDKLEKHGTRKLYVKRDFESIKNYLRENYMEGIVFWKDGQPQCKIKRSDFGFPWGNR